MGSNNSDGSGVQAAAAARVQHHGQQLSNGFSNPNHLKFQARLPAGLPVHITPLNPVNFLLRSAFIRPHRVALKHPAIGVEWTYSEW